MQIRIYLKKKKRQSSHVHQEKNEESLRKEIPATLQLVSSSVEIIKI